MYLIGRSIRLAIVFIFWTGAFALILLYLYYKAPIWLGVSNWIEQSAKFSRDPVHTLTQSARWPVWLSLWIATFAWWLLLFSALAQLKGRGGGTIYRTATANSNTGDFAIMNVPVGQTPIDESEGIRYLFTAFCYAPLMIFLCFAAYFVAPFIPMALHPDDRIPAALIVVSVGLSVPIAMVSFVLVDKLMMARTAFSSALRKIVLLAGVVLALDAVAWTVIIILILADVLKGPA